MNKWIVLLLLWVLILVQVAFLAAARPLGVVPQLFITGLLYVGFYRSVRLAFLAAGWGGFWLWVYSLTTGLWVAFAPFLFVLFILLIKRFGFNLEKTIVQVAALSVAVVLTNLIAIGYLSWQEGELLFSTALLRPLILEWLFTLVFAWALRPLLQLIIRPL